MHPDRPTWADRLQGALRTLAVLLACLGLAGVSLAAAGGRAAADPGAAVVAAARAHLADPYTWGAAGPDTWDCSGLTSTLWRTVGGVKAVPRTAREQQAWAVPLPAEQVRPGDLAFFGEPVTHVGFVASRRTTRAGTTVQMIDASATLKGVVTRQVWTSGVVRFGRVPRAGMVKVTPWRPPAPVVVRRPAVPPAALLLVTPLGKGQTALSGLTSTAAASPRGLKAAQLATGYLGNTVLTDVDLIRNLWHRAGGPVLPATRDGLTAKAVPVSLKDARVGDLVVYGPPASHVGIYVGKGLMIDASRSLGKVVLRKVWSGSSVRLVRLAA